jgi:hypothetical protein
MLWKLSMTPFLSLTSAQNLLIRLKTDANLPLPIFVLPCAPIFSMDYDEQSFLVRSTSRRTFPQSAQAIIELGT